MASISTALPVENEINMPKGYTLSASICSSSDDSELVAAMTAMSQLPRCPMYPAFSTNVLLGFRASMSADGDADNVRKSMCQAKLQPTTYETGASSKSKLVAPVRYHHTAPPLTPTAGSWSAQQRTTCGTPEKDDNEKVGRAARSILNKITAETFDSLFEQLVTCGIEKPEHITKLMSEVFDMATTQHHFIPMYADLCVRLEQDPRISAVVKAAGQQHNFRRLLLNQCQVVFEQLLEPCNAEAALDDEVGVPRIDARKQEALGNIKLIGHVLVNGMLTSKMLVDCAEELIGKRTTCPEALESLAALMMVAAATFDTSEWQHHEKLNSCFDTMRKLAKDKKTVPRSRFLLRDVLDMREAGWPTSTKNSSVIRAESQRIIQDAKHEESQNTQEVFSMAAAAPVPAEKGSFDLKAFRRTLAAILADLTSNRNVSAAVQRVRMENVPEECQAEQFSDLITRIVEEKRGPPRRCAMAFAAGLAAADEQSAFEREQCLAGLVSFFQDIYPDLCNEVPRLPAIVRSELTPTFCSVFPTAEINSRLPPGVRF